MKLRLLIFFYSTVLTMLFFGCTQHPMDGSTRGWGHMMGYGGYGGMFMWLILILITGVIIYVIFNRNKRPGSLDGSTRESATGILKRRYASGEISKEAFDRLKKDIQG
jgi:putative membrane protein